MTGRFEIPSTRQNGRKVDTWSYFLPEDKVDFTVTLITDENGSRFVAKSDHTALAGKAWGDTDIERLAETVKTDVSSLFSDLMEDRWRPALVLEVDPATTVRHGRKNFKLSLMSESVRIDTKTPRQNDGRRRIEKNGSLGLIQERSIPEASRLSKEAGSIKIDIEGSRTIVNDTEDTRKALEAIQDTLEVFGRLLAQRISPDQSNPDDLPDPDELVRMMQQAAGGATL